MVQRRGHPTPSEWEQIRSDLEHWYLEDDLPLKEVRERFSKRGFEATERQYKTKVSAWGLDKKKIREDTWQAMYVVMNSRKELGKSLRFEVPTHGDRHIRTVTTDMIRKEYGRNKFPSDWRDLRRAEGHLQENNIKYYEVEDGPSDQGLRQPSWVRMPPGAGGITGVLRPFSAAHDGFVNHFGYGDMLSGSTSHVAGTAETSDFMDIIQYTSPTELSHSALGKRPLSHSPRLELLGSRPHKSVRSSSHGSLPNSSPGPTVRSCDQMMISRPSVSFSTGRDLISHAVQSSLCGPEDRSKLLLDSQWVIAIQWIEPYADVCLRRGNQEPEVDLDWRGRRTAKDAFRTMLRTNNRYIFPYCNWMVTVLASNNQSVKLMEFLRDCCDVLDEDDMDFDQTHGTPIHLVMALWTENKRDMESHHSGFLTSNKIIEMIWGVDSPNYIVNQYYLAWLQLARNQHEDAIKILEQCLPIARRSMGNQNIVTMNCLTILSRALGETGRKWEAVRRLEEVLHLLTDCTQLLQPYRDRQTMRLALLQIDIGDVQRAETTLQEVIRFRSAHFGLISSLTWAAVDRLKELLTSQGRLEESGRLWQSTVDLYDHKFAEAWLDRYKVPAPWIFHT